MTSFTTFVGFGSLIVASVTTIQRFGLACAFGVLLTFIVVTLLVPLVSSLARDRWLVKAQREQGLLESRRFFDVLSGFILHFPRSITAIGIVVTAVLAVAGVQLQPDNQLAETIPKHLESTRALATIDRKLGGMLQVSVLLTPLASRAIDAETISLLREVHEALDRAPHVSRPHSVLSALELVSPDRSPERLAASSGLLKLAPPDLIVRVYSPATGLLAVRTLVPDIGAAALETSFAQIERELESIRERYPDYKVELTGTTLIAVRNVRLMIGDLARSLGFAALVIFFAMSIAFRSLRLGVISVIPNLFPIVATAALLVAIGLPLQITSVIVFSVCLGIAVDDTIHFIARFRRELRESDDGLVRGAIERAFARVGSALLITTAVLMCGFGTVIISTVPAIRLYALLSCVAITMALVGDLVILPAMLLCFVRDRKVVRRGGEFDERSTPQP